MNPSIVSSIGRLANYMPLGSYVIYTALETYSFSLGTTPSPITTIIQTPAANYTCLYIPGGSFTYTSCTADQSNALCISLSIGFFLAVFLSFLKHVPVGGTPPLAEEEDDDGDGDSAILVNESTQTTQLQQTQQQQTPIQHTKGGKLKRPKYRSGVIYAQGNYYLDFGDYHVWGHAALSFVAFGTLSLFSSSVSQCLFPKVKPWIFVFTQIILLVICCFIAMFWIDDPSLSIGLMVVPATENHSTQTGGGNVVSLLTAGGTGGAASNSRGAAATVIRSTQFAAATTSNVATNTSAYPTMNLSQFNASPFTSGAITSINANNNTKNRMSTQSSATPMMNAPMNTSTSSIFSTSTAVSGSNNTNSNGLDNNTASSAGTGAGVGGGRLGIPSKRVPIMCSVDEKHDDEEAYELGETQSVGSPSSPLVQGIMVASSLESSPPPQSPSSSLSVGHVSVKID
ncbi:hypothetical protein FBU30_000690 [Linnemannia zychae]|nr:hypothetical protein FBU30_000690 [Linnemannia zychae]